MLPPSDCGTAYGPASLWNTEWSWPRRRALKAEKGCLCFFASQIFGHRSRQPPFAADMMLLSYPPPAGVSGHGIIASETDVYGQFKDVVRLSVEKKKYLDAR